MDITSVLNLLIAICRILEVRPEDLAEAFLEKEQNQEYFSLLANLQTK